MKIKLKIPQKTDYPENIFLSIDGLEGCASAYFQTNPFLRHFFIKRLKEIIKLIPDRQYQSILDVGTGVGFFLPTLSLLGEKVIALDNTSIVEAVKYMLAKRDISNVEVCRADIKEIPFDSESFDLIIATSVLEHVKDLDSAFIELKRVLKKDGTLIIGYPIENKFIVFLRKIEAYLRPNLNKAVSQELETNSERGHLSNYLEIKNQAKKHFNIEENIFLKALGLLRIYEILELKKKGIYDTGF